MLNMDSKLTLIEEIFLDNKPLQLLKQILLVVFGILVLVLFSKIKVPIWPSPVPINLATLSVLTIGLTYGTKLGFATVLGYLIIGTLGYDIFANSSAK